MRRLAILALMPPGFMLLAPGGHAVIGHSQSAKQLVQAATRALLSAKSVRLSGSIATSTGSTKVDFILFSNNDLKGSLTLNGDLVNITVVNGTDYYQAPPAYWQTVGGLPPTLAKSIAPDWISTPNSSSSGIGDSFELAPLASQLSSSTGLSIVGHEKVNGQAAVGIQSSHGGVLWIASSGTPYPISEVKKGSGGGTLSFSGWNSFKLPAAPKGATSLSSLTK